MTLPNWTRRAGRALSGLAVATLVAGTAFMLLTTPVSEAPERVEFPDVAYVEHGGIDPARGWAACNARVSMGLEGEPLAAWLSEAYGVSMERGWKIVALSGEFLCPGSVPKVNA